MSQALPSILESPARLEALRQLGLLDSPPEPAFDRLTRLAARLLQAPVALIALVDRDRQFFKSIVGLSEPWATLRETPLSHSFCQYAVASGAPLIVQDARTHPLVLGSLAIRELHIVAYAGIPLITRGGHALGALSVIDTAPRAWTDDEIATLTDLAATAMTEIELRIEIAHRKQAEETAGHLAEQRKQLLEVAQALVSTLEIDELLPNLWRTLQGVLEYDSLSTYWLDQAAGVLLPAQTNAPPWFSDQVSTWPIPLGSGIVGAVGASGRAELVNDAHLDPRSIYPPGTVDVRPHHIICVPIRTNDRIRGVLIMSRNEGAPFTAQEFQLVQLFESFVALAIENARLFEQIRESEARFSTIFRASPVAYTITSLATGRFVEVNQAFVDLMGYSRDEVIGRTTVELSAWANPADRERVVQMLQEHLSIRSLELTFRTSSGAMLETLASMEIVELGGERCILSLTQDITSYKHAEAALRESEERFAKAFRASPVASCITTLTDGRYLDVNDSFLRLLGYRRDQVIGHTSRELPMWADPADRAGIIEQLHERGSINDLERRIRTRSGELRDTLTSLELIDLAGERCILTHFHDITERRRAEQALRESEERFKAIYEHAPVMIDAFTDDRRCILWNKECEKQFGYSADEIRAIPDPMPLFYPDPEVYAAVLRFISRPDGIFREYQAQTKDGSIRDQMWANFALPNNMIIGVGYDITDRRRAEQEQRRLILELQEAITSVKTLRGLLPICSSCKKIRDDRGYWNQLETYITTHSEADFTHGICPDCIARLYGELYDE